MSKKHDKDNELPVTNDDAKLTNQTENIDGQVSEDTTQQVTEANADNVQESKKSKDKAQDSKSADKKKAKKKENKQNAVAKKTKETVSELKKVSWPSFSKVVKKTGVVIAVMIIFTVVLFGIDRLLALLFDLFTSALG